MARVISKRRQQPGVDGGKGNLAIIKGIWEERSLGREKGQDARMLLWGLWNVQVLIGRDPRSLEANTGFDMQPQVDTNGAICPFFQRPEEWFLLADGNQFCKYLRNADFIHQESYSAARAHFWTYRLPVNCLRPNMGRVHTVRPLRKPSP